MARLLVLVCALSLGCQASANAQVTANSSGDAQATGDAQAASASPGQTKPTSDTSSSSTGTDDSRSPSPGAQPALFGARAGLHLAKTGTANCQCLTVAVGQPNDARLQWDGQATAIDPGSQMVVALGSDGIDCPSAPKDSLGASYRGYEAVGADVTILVETGRMGRPLAGGAIVPKPTAGGRIIIRPVDNKTPYGRSLDGKENACIVWSAP